MQQFRILAAASRQQVASLRGMVQDIITVLSKLGLDVEGGN